MKQCYISHLDMIMNNYPWFCLKGKLKFLNEPYLSHYLMTPFKRKSVVQ